MERGLYCYDCKGIKENQKSGYCHSCNRIRYRKRQKPNCFLCDTLKENPNDSYCKECKRKRQHEKSLLLGKRTKNTTGLGRKIFCSKCKKEKEVGRENESYCASCKYQMKKLRAKTPEQKFKDHVRKITWHRIRKGKLVKMPCEVCGNIKVDAHHDDYDKPFQIRWLCRKHHQEHHKEHGS